MRLYLTTILSILFSLTFYTACAQMQFENVSNDLKLPSRECYSVMQDKHGYLWIATEAGMCRYNGSAIKVFNAKYGLPEGAVYAVFEALDSTLWMATSKGRIVRYKNDSLRETRIGKDYYRLSDNGFGISPPYKFSATETGIYIHSKKKAIKADFGKRTLEKICTDTIDANYIFHQTETGLVPVNMIRGTLTNGPVKIVIVYDDHRLHISVPFEEKPFPYWQVYTCRIGHTDFLSFENRLIKLNPDESYSMYTYPDRIISLYVDGQNGLWVGAIKSGVYYYRDIEGMKLSSHNLNGYSVSGTCEDAERNIWCTTLEKGLFLCKNKNIIFYPSLLGPIYAWIC